MDRRDALIIFAKAPDPGRVKTRIAAALGEERAVAVYRALAERVLATSAALRADRVRRVVAFDPADAGDRMRAWLGGDGLEYVPQAPGDLGVRLRAAFEEAFARGAPAACAIGTDCAQVEPAHLEAALAAVRETDVAVGPAADGGYWAIALARPRSVLFEDVPWSTERVLAVTLERARAAGLRVRLLPTLADVDRPEDIGDEPWSS